jgi:hypothetical protein
VPILFASLSGPLLVLTSFTDVLGDLRCGLFVSNRPFTFWIYDACFLRSALRASGCHGNDKSCIGVLVSIV